MQKDVIIAQWNVPSLSHTSIYNIVHSVAHLPSISDTVFKRFSTFFNRGVVSSSCLISQILSQSSLLAYTFTGYKVDVGIFESVVLWV